MGKMRKAASSRKPPEPSESHAEIEDWMRRAMPDLQPVVEHLDATIRNVIPGLHYALKWKKAHYGLPDVGWIIEMVAYDVSVNLVFYAGAELHPPPPLGEGRSRYVKVKNLEEARAPEIRGWIEQAASISGWE